MDRKINVSVIIPVYNVEPYLERAVDSVLSQTCKELEIILVDDGSTDASGEICDRLCEEHPDLIRVIHKENEGLGMARNSGLKVAKGEYITFLDSDDEVQSEMYRKMYEKAKEEEFDMVFCDVEIVYVESNKQTIVKTYPEDRIDVPDYIANGNNITYSVNKLYKRYIWEENQYEKMLFEDIALIPSLVTKYPHIGYVKEPFYRYYRRPNTISTTLSGDMVDIVQAFRLFLEQSNPAYKNEVVYCTAKQLYWNMNQSRSLFRADFVSFIQEYETDFRLNPYIEKDEKIKTILDCIQEKVIPEIFFLPCEDNETLPDSFREMLKEHFPKAEQILVKTGKEEILAPESVQKAWRKGKTMFVLEYLALRLLYEKGGIVLFPSMQVNIRLKALRLNSIFFGFEDVENITTGCFGAQKHHYVIRALLDTYKEDHIYNEAFLPLKERIRDFLILHFHLNPNGRNQILKQEIKIYHPGILSCDMKDGENCCKLLHEGIPEGYELISDQVLEMWSKRILDNWNLYKKERTANEKQGSSFAEETVQTVPKNMDEEIQKVVDTYENSTCWKLTKPVRMFGELLKKA